jgi:hypothetical protein
VSGEKCDIIEDAITRYYSIIFYPGGNSRETTVSFDNPLNNKQFRGYLDSVEIQLNKPCEYLPQADMLESCNYVFQLTLSIIAV